MSGGAGILPVVNIAVDYEIQRQNITDFLRFFKAPHSSIPLGSGNFVEEDEQPLTQDDMDLQEDFDEMNVEGEDMDEDGFGAGRRRGRRDTNRMVPKYMMMMQQVANKERDTIVIDLNDVAKHRLASNNDSLAPLASQIRGNALRYIDLFSEAIDKCMPSSTHTPEDYVPDTLEVIIGHYRERERAAREERNEGRQEDGVDGENQPDALDEVNLPPALMRRYDIYFKPLDSDVTLAVRAVRGAHLGKLLTVRGIVTRVSDVKPFLLVDSYTCDLCGDEMFQEVKARSYMPLIDCKSRICTTNQKKGKLNFQPRASKFVPFQEVKIQEMADQVPVGHIPRSMTVHLYGGLTRTVNPGDVINLGGIFLPVPYQGFRAITAGLLTDTYLQAQHVHQVKKQYTEMERTPEIDEKIAELMEDEAHLYDKLASSIAPEIYGHEDVKKVLLLLLIGGVTKEVGDGMKIRGDLNVCLMGDPGVAKSQLLKYISKVAPRGIYTTGRGSSGVGLTAAVMRDPVTDEMVLEGGALVLADNGIACIDEFDKMDDSDRTAIHEVMEQQTISIAKAGITTTLNARTSILAAANPLYGRYNPRVSPVDNINLPAALLSRFDILFLILDTPAREDDERLAQHVTYVHMFNEHPPLAHEPIDPVIMRHYISTARTKRPIVPKEVSDYVVGAYVKLRAQHKEDEKNDKSFTYTSARTLLGVLRLSQALARLRWADRVERPDVDEALRLMDVSKASLLNHGRGQQEAGHDNSPVSKIFRIIKEMANNSGMEKKERNERKRSNRPIAGRGRAAKSSGRLGKGPGGERGGNSMDVDDDDSLQSESGQGDDDEDEEDEDENEGQELMMRDVRDRVIAAGWVEDQLQETIQEYSDLGIIQIIGNRLMFV